MSRDEASQKTGINNATLYRIETAKARPQMRTLAALLTLYGVDADQREYLTNLCRDTGKRGWLQPYHSDLPEEHTAYISFEDEAAGVRNYQSLIVPGLLQTEDYARAIVRDSLSWATDAQVADRVQARMDRQGARIHEGHGGQWGQFLVTLLTMTTMPLAEVKAHLSELVGRVHGHHERVTVTVHGRPSAVLLAVEDLEALEETVSVLSDPDTLRRLVESDAELARGEVVGTEQLAESMAARRRDSA